MEKTESDNNYLETGSLGKLMAKFAIPTVISLLVGALYNIVDQIFISNADYLGSYGNAANTAVYPLTVIALALAVLFGDGCCAFSSICAGAKRADDGRRSIGISIVSTVAVSIVLMIIYFVFGKYLIICFGGNVNETTYELAQEYLFYITIGIPFYMFGQMMSSVIRSDGSPGYAMAVLIAGAVTNVILDYVFIYPLKLGMMGAALATIIGQFVAAVMSVVYLFRMKTMRLDLDAFKFRWNLFKKIVPLGVSSFLAQIAIVISMLAVNQMAKKYGAMDEIFGQEEYSQIPIAVIGIVMKFFQIVISCAVGIAAGCIPLAGYNIGARRADRAKKLFTMILITEAVVGALFTIVFMCFPTQLMEIFGSANESEYYMEFGVYCIRSFLCLTILACVNKGTFIYLQALGKPVQSSVLSLIREIVFGAGLPLVLPLIWGIYGLPWFMPLSDALTAIISAVVIVRTYKELNEMSRQNELAAAEASQEETEQQLYGEPAGAYSAADMPETEQLYGESGTAYPAADRPEPLTGMIITIGREYGAGGRPVGKLVAEKLNIPYYDSQVLEEVAAVSGLSQKYLAETEEKSIQPGSLYSYNSFSSGHSSAVDAIAVRAQREVIEGIADRGPCVIVGRRADQILKDRGNVFSVFVHATLESRVRRIMERDGLSEKEATRKCRSVDSERESYYNLLASDVWGRVMTYNLSLQTDLLGYEKAADIIVESVLACERQQLG